MRVRHLPVRDAAPPAAPRPRRAAVVALAPWLVAHLIVGAALLATALAPGPLPTAGEAPGARGLWVWDAAWYRLIAERGYGPDPEAARFFPLLPLLGRGLGALLGGRVDVALLTVSAVGSLAYGALLVRLVRRETGDEAAASRTAWLAMLAPGAGVLVLAYTEPVAGALAVGFFLALRVGTAPIAGVPRAGTARTAGVPRVGTTPTAGVLCGVLSGLTRPTGVLLVAPAVVELLCRRPTTTRGWCAGIAVAASPAIGTGGYCLWAWARYGDPLLPYTVQTRDGLRGGLAANPLPHLFGPLYRNLDWRLQLVLLLLAVALLVVTFRRLPAAYGVWAALALVASVTSLEGHSLPRYLAGSFPLLVAGALVVGRRRTMVIVLVVCSAVFGYVAFVGFTPDYVL